MNLLVTFLYDLGRNYAQHAEIHALCVESYRRRLEGCDEVRTLTGATGQANPGGHRLNDRAAAYGEMLRDVFRQVEALWYKGHNVLLVDADTACERPTPWPEGKGLRLFNYGCCRVPYNAWPPAVYRHSGVRYLPATMSEDVWDVAALLIEQWDDRMWAYDQYVWNAMYWMQDTREGVDPRYCWVAAEGYHNGSVPREEAYIVHFGETRGLARCLRRMRRMVGVAAKDG